MKINLSILLSILIFVSTNTQAELVKQSKSGICHDENSASYKRTKNFTAFDSLEACIKAGGKLPKGHKGLEQASKPSDVLEKLDTALKGKEYDRKYFGHGWSDEDGDCQDARQEALIAQSLSKESLKYKGDKNVKNDQYCSVIFGKWISPFTNQEYTNAGQLDIDHIAPLKFAWTYGADSWTEAKRKQFANDPENLLAVEAKYNRQKGAKDIEEWLPPANKCEYINKFLMISEKYNLQFPRKKKIAFDKVKKTHCA